MKKKIWQKFSALCMVLALMMPSIVQATEIVITSNVEENTKEMVGQDSKNTELTKNKLSTEVENPQARTVGSDEPVNEEILEEDSDSEVVSTNTIIDGMHFSFTGTDGNSTARVVNYTGPVGGSVSVPAQVLNTAAGWGTPSPVHAIGHYAFSAKGLTSVNLPNSLVRIDDYAFSNNSLTNIEIPNGVTEIGRNAFNFNNITSVNLPNNLVRLGAYAFAVNRLTNVEIPNGLTRLEAAVFATNSLTSVDIPDNVVEIGSQAFVNNNLTSVYISDNVTNIGSIAFGSNSLEYIETNLENMDALRALLSVNAMHSVTARTILRALDYENGTDEERSAFVGQTVDYAISQQYQLQSTNNLVWEEYTPVVQWFKDDTALPDRTDPLLQLKSVTPNDSGVYHAIVDTIRYPNLYLEVQEEFEFEFTGTDGESTATLMRYNGEGGDVVIPSEALNTEAGWTSPSPVKTIAPSVFQSRQLTSVLIPDSVTLIGRHAFDSNLLTNLTIPNSVTTIDSFAFSQNKLSSLKIPDGLEVLSQGIFLSNSLTNVTIPNSVKIIDEGAFYNNQLTSVIIPNNVTTINERAFASNKLISLELSEGLEVLSEAVFRENFLTNVVIPNSVQIIGSEAFYRNNLTTLTIPNGITSIERRAFAFNRISLVEFPSTISGIDQAVFAHNPLRYIETESAHVERIRDLLSEASMQDVTERTIIRALDYEIETEEQRSIIVGQDVAFAIAQQYRLQSTTNRVWEEYTPEVQWEKNESAIEGANFPSLELTNVQESDSGIYKAIVDGTPFPDLQLEVIPEIEPEIPAIDPSEPPASPENVNPYVAGLSIRYASDIHFNSAPFSLSDQTLFLDSQENQPMVTVQDMRPKSERSGWELLVSQDAPFMNGAEIVMNPFIHQANQDSLLIDASSELVLNDAPQRFAGTTNTENPSGIVSMGLESKENPMFLRVPGKTGVNSYETTVHWQLVTGP